MKPSADEIWQIAWVQISKEVRQVSIYCLLSYSIYAEYTLGEAGLEEDEHNFKILDAMMCLYMHWQWFSCDIVIFYEEQENKIIIE